MRPIICSALMALAITTARADDLFEQLDGVLSRVGQLHRDVLNAGKGVVLNGLRGRGGGSAFADAAWCYLMLSESLGELQHGLLRLNTAVLIALQMRDADDEQAAVTQVKTASTQLLQFIEGDRPSLNRLPSDCPTNAFVAVKVQETLNLYTAATAPLRSAANASDIRRTRQH